MSKRRYIPRKGGETYSQHYYPRRKDAILIKQGARMLAWSYNQQDYGYTHKAYLYLDGPEGHQPLDSECSGWPARASMLGAVSNHIVTIQAYFRDWSLDSSDVKNGKTLVLAKTAKKKKGR